MAEYLIQGDTLTDIADAIRDKLGVNATIRTSNMAAAISAIETTSGDSSSGTGSGTSSSVTTGSVTLSSASATITVNASFTPTKLILYGPVTGSNEHIMTFIYDSANSDAHFSVYYTLTSGAQMTTDFIGNPSSDDPYFWVKKPSSTQTSIIVGVNSAMSLYFAPGTWTYIAIA